MGSNLSDLSDLTERIRFPSDHSATRLLRIVSEIDFDLDPLELTEEQSQRLQSVVLACSTTDEFARSLLWPQTEQRCDIFFTKTQWLRLFRVGLRSCDFYCYGELWQELANSRRIGEKKLCHDIFVIYKDLCQRDLVDVSINPWTTEGRISLPDWLNDVILCVARFLPDDHLPLLKQFFLQKSFNSRNEDYICHLLCSLWQDKKIDSAQLRQLLEKRTFYVTYFADSPSPEVQKNILIWLDWLHFLSSSGELSQTKEFCALAAAAFCYQFDPSVEFDFVHCYQTLVQANHELGGQILTALLESYQQPFRRLTNSSSVVVYQLLQADRVLNRTEKELLNQLQEIVCPTVKKHPLTNFINWLLCRS